MHVFLMMEASNSGYGLFLLVRRHALKAGEFHEESGSTGSEGPQKSRIP